MTSTNSNDNAQAIEVAAGLLGLVAPAPQVDIKNAFRLFAQLTHPDLNPDNPDAAQEFRRIRYAADVLTDVNLHRASDPYKVRFLLTTPARKPNPKVVNAYCPRPAAAPTVDIRL